MELLDKAGMTGEHEWKPGGLELLGSIQGEIEDNGGEDACLIRVMNEWPSLYFKETKDRFISLLPYYTVFELAKMFGMSYSQAVRMRKRYPHPIERFKSYRRAKRKTNRTVVPVMHLETGIYYEFQRDAAIAYNIPLGSIFHIVELGKLFIRL